MNQIEENIRCSADACRSLDCLLRRAGIYRVSLFGSRARGDHRADSDWDILLECSRPLTPPEYWRIKKSFIAILGPCDMASPQYAEDFFVGVIQPDRIPIWF